MGIQGMKIRRRFGLLGAGLLLGLPGIFLLRAPLTRAVVSAGLKRAGAGDITLEVDRATPWSVQLKDLAFKIKAQAFAASRVTLERAHWWQPTLGVVHIEGARVPVTIDGSDMNPFVWTSYSGETPATGGDPRVPMEKLSVDGQLIVKTSGHEQPLALKFAAQPAGKDNWNGTLEVTGPGLLFNAVASYGLNDRRLAFHSTALSVELKPWQDLIPQLVVLPLGPWTMEGRLTGGVNGTYAEQKLTVGGKMQLNEGALKNSAGSLMAEGIEADFDFLDLIHLQSNPGTLRIHEFRAGAIAAEDLAAEVAFLSADHLAINRMALKIFGGSMTAEPFKLILGQQELEAVVLADNLDVEKILALANNVPAKGSGRVDGRLPIRIDEHGLRLGTGWLELKKGVHAELQLDEAGLITSGMSPNSTSYVVMKRIENGLLRLKLGVLRLDVRPPDVSRGQSARLHLEGEPVDPSVKAPVILDVNVNGPLEQLLNFGLKDNLSFGTGKR